MWSSSTTGKHLWHAKGDVNYIRWTSEKYLLFIKNEINTLFYVQFLIIFIVLSPTCFDSFRITLRKTYRGIYNFTIILNIVKVTQIIYIYTHTHKHTYMYICVCVYACVPIAMFLVPSTSTHKDSPWQKLWIPNTTFIYWIFLHLIQHSKGNLPWSNVY